MDLDNLQWSIWHMKHGINFNWINRGKKSFHSIWEWKHQTHTHTDTLTRTHRYTHSPHSPLPPSCFPMFFLHLSVCHCTSHLKFFSTTLTRYLHSSYLKYHRLESNQRVIKHVSVCFRLRSLFARIIEYIFHVHGERCLGLIFEPYGWVSKQDSTISISISSTTTNSSGSQPLQREFLVPISLR